MTLLYEPHRGHMPRVTSHTGYAYFEGGDGADKSLVAQRFVIPGVYDHWHKQASRQKTG